METASVQSITQRAINTFRWKKTWGHKWRSIGIEQSVQRRERDDKSVGQGSIGVRFRRFEESFERSRPAARDTSIKRDFVAREQSFDRYRYLRRID